MIEVGKGRFYVHLKNGNVFESEEFEGRARLFCIGPKIEYFPKPAIEVIDDYFKATFQQRYPFLRVQTIWVRLEEIEVIEVKTEPYEIEVMEEG